MLYLFKFLGEKRDSNVNGCEGQDCDNGPDVKGKHKGILWKILFLNL